jgi:creatinine amidohydrolase/Fe(II)-dependent formamide hydrolase-like protein
VTEPARGHMSKAGTITLPNEFFMKLLEYAARSFKLHGFTDIVMIGDSGGNQNGMRDVAAMLTEEWAGTGVRVHHVPEYYSGNGFQEWLEAQGHSRQEIGSHAGINDTSQLLAVAPDMIRTDKLAPGGGMEDSGVSGDPAKASAEYGRQGIEMKIAVTVDRVRELVGSREDRFQGVRR